VTRALRFNNDTTTPVRLDVSVGRAMIIVSGEILRGCRREWNAPSSMFVIEISKCLTRILTAARVNLPLLPNPLIAKPSLNKVPVDFPIAAGNFQEDGEAVG
jgi:hypothetical protein